MHSLPPVDVEADEAVTRAFRATSVLFTCSHRLGQSGASNEGFILVENTSWLHDTFGSPPVNVQYEEPILRPEAAALFGDVAEALFSQMEI